MQQPSPAHVLSAEEAALLEQAGIAQTETIAWLGSKQTLTREFSRDSTAFSRLWELGASVREKL